MVKLESELKLTEIVNNANCRSGACLSVEDCLQQIKNLSPYDAIEKLKCMLMQGKYELEDLQEHIAILWVMHDLGKIQFPTEDYGLALSVQNIARMEKAELAARMLSFLEKNLTFKD